MRKVDAGMLDVLESGGIQEATVLFDSALREREPQRPTQLRETWHFARTAGALAPTRFLHRIEQMGE